MKQIILIFLLLSSAFVYSQKEESKIIVEPLIGLDIANDGDGGRGFNTSISIGKPVIETLIFGLGLEYIYDAHSVDGGDKEEKILMLKPFVRQYIGRGDVRLYIQPGASIGRVKVDYGGDNLKDFVFGFSGDIGTSIKLGNKTSLMLGTYYDRMFSDIDVKIREYRIGIKCGLSFNL